MIPPPYRGKLARVCRYGQHRLSSPTGNLDLAPAGRELIAWEGYDPVYGARPLRRFISLEVETRISRALLSGEIHDGATISLDADDGKLVVRWENQAAPAEAEPAVPSRRPPTSPPSPAANALRGRAGVATGMAVARTV